MTETTITIGEVRFSYISVFEPMIRPGSDSAKFSVTLLLPKTNTAAKASLDKAVNAAIEAGVAKKWNSSRPPQPAICVHDGDGTRPSDGAPFGDECKGCWVFTASSNNPPFVVDASVQPILDRREVYSGAYGFANVTFFAYSNTGKKGIGCGLNGIQKVRDGEPLSARVTADEAFSPAVTKATINPFTGTAY